MHNFNAWSFLEFCLALFMLPVVEMIIEEVRGE